MSRRVHFHIAAFFESSESVIIYLSPTVVCVIELGRKDGSWTWSGVGESPSRGMCKFRGSGRSMGRKWGW